MDLKPYLHKLYHIGEFEFKFIADFGGLSESFLMKFALRPK